MGHITWGLIVACGKDEQLLSQSDTAFLTMGTKPVLMYSLMAYEKCDDIDGVVVVVRKDRMDDLKNMVQMFGCSKVKKIVAGSSNRRMSVKNGLNALDDDVSIVSIHNASRPCVSNNLIADTVKAAKRYGSGIAASKVLDGVKEVGKGHKVAKTLDHANMWTVQTPQTFKTEILHHSLNEAAKKKVDVDDESFALERMKKEVHLVPSSHTNLRIKTPTDLNLATAFLTRSY